MTSGYCETDLVVELARRRNVTFLLNMEAHSGGTGRNAATLRSKALRDNQLRVI